MAELTRGEKAKQTRIAKIGLEAYQAEQAAKGKKGGVKGGRPFKKDPELARAAGRKGRRLPKSILKTDSGLHFEDRPEFKPTEHAKEL